MARIRSIHPRALESEKLAEASAEAERFYWRLAVECDDEGRCEDAPKVLAAKLFPQREDIIGQDVDAWLAELDDIGLVIRYRAGGKQLVQVTKWAEFQKPQHSKASEFLPPPDLSCPLSEAEGDTEGAHEASGSLMRVIPDDGLGVGEGVGEGVGVGAPTSGAKPTKRGSQLPDEFTVDDDMRSWAAHGCPDINVDHETAQWRDWHRAKGDTAKDWQASWRTWLRKAQTYAQERSRPALARGPSRVDQSIDNIAKALVR